MLGGVFENLCQVDNSQRVSSQVVLVCCEMREVSLKELKLHSLCPTCNAYDRTKACSYIGRQQSLGWWVGGEHIKELKKKKKGLH